MTELDRPLPFGAHPESDGVRFRVWAPGHRQVDVILYGPDAERVHPLEAEGDGFFGGRVPGAGPGSRYKYRLDGQQSYPDPASRGQPDGVHHPSEVVDPDAFRWTDAGWRGRPLEELVIYELHVGTFTEAGTFEAAIERLDHLEALGVTALELMPVADFPGDRNWGYDGVYLYAPARAYGGPEGLKRLVDAAHARGLAVLLDVVYNHFGPEGNYLPAVTSGRVFNDAHHTPWGAAINYDGDDCGPVREFVVQNGLFWLREYHLDGLRLDATHAIIDDSPTHLLRELAARVRAAVPPGRSVVLIAEDERNERRLIAPAEEGGFGLDAVWADDFHHQVRRLSAGDEEGYFRNYSGTVADLADTLRKGWFYEGQHYPGHGAPRGTPADDLPPIRFVHTIQNHDQIGNRAHGERLHHEIGLDLYRTVSALLLLSPYSPLLFMGQEWAASSPFLYFTDHPDELGRLVTRGRREEFRHFPAFAEADRRERIPDPQGTDTFARSRLRWPEREQAPHQAILCLYRELLALRTSHPALRERRRGFFDVEAPAHDTLLLRRRAPAGDALLLACSFAGATRLTAAESDLLASLPGVIWRPLLWTEEPRFGGAGGAPRLPEQGIELPGTGAVVLAAGGMKG